MKYIVVIRVHLALIVALALVFVATDPLAAIAQGIYQLQSDSLPQPGVPHGVWLQFDLTSTKYYPGAKTAIQVYVPSEYKPETPACLYVGLDGPGFHISDVMDNLIFKKQMPVTIGVFVPSSSINVSSQTATVRYDRCFEFDSTNDRFDHYLMDEVMPQVEKLTTGDGRAIHISTDPNDHMIAGGSSGGVCAFTAAWEHPDLFRRVFTAIGTYVGMRGADSYPTLIRKTEPKPIRIFLQDGAVDSWNALFDNWYTQNKSMEESLRFAGYDVDHNWGILGHEGSHADSLFPSAMKWIWRDYPEPITAGKSSNSMLNSILVSGNDWQPLVLPAKLVPACLISDPTGILFFTDGSTGNVYRSASGSSPTVFCHTGASIACMAFTKSGTLYAAQPSLSRIIAITSVGRRSVVASGIVIGHLTVLADGTIYASQPAAHDDMPSVIWRIDSAGHRTIVDKGLYDAQGIVVTGDHSEAFVVEGRTHWVYSYVIGASGDLEDKQRYYWLHTSETDDDEPDDGAGATDIETDTSGYLYVASRIGVQVCDRNGRVEGILSLSAGEVTSLAFCGSNFKTLAVSCGGEIYTRMLNASGNAGFADIIKLPDYGAG